MMIPIGLPAFRWARLRYVESITLNPGVAAIAFHYFRANSLFDPDFTGVGHQPMNYDQISIGYQHYTVFQAKIRMSYIKQSVSGAVPGIFGIFLDDNTTPGYLSAEAIIESNQRNSKWRQTAGVEDINRSIQIGFDAKKFFGASSLSAAQYRPAVTASPVEGAFFCCYLGDIGGNDPSLESFMIEIEYTALFSEKKFLAQS